jgi:hypothetical protein
LKVSQGRSQHEAGSKQSRTLCLLHTGFLLSVCFDQEAENDIPPNHWLIFGRLQSVVLDKIEFFLLHIVNTYHSFVQKLCLYILFLHHLVAQNVQKLFELQLNRNHKPVL